jgi:small subunit ribosomal protein S17
MAKVLTGIVVSSKLENTAIVLVENKFRHPMYKKIIKKGKRFKAHVSDIKVELGDTVLIEETRPISKDKYFKVVKNLKGNPTSLKELRGARKVVKLKE